MSDLDRTVESEDVHELLLRRLADDARTAVDTKRRELDAAAGEFNAAAARLAACVRERLPNEDELVYGDSLCACGAPVAHWPDALHEAWHCSAVLLGRVADGPHHDEPRLFVLSRIRTSRARVTRST